MRSLLRRVGVVSVLCACAMLLPRIAYAQTAPVELTVLTPAAIVIATLSFLTAFLVNAYNSGKFFGLTTVPVTWLPYIGVAAPFVTAVGASLQGSGALSGVAVFNGIQAGLFALIASAGGASTHRALQTHFRLAATTRTVRAAKAGMQ